MTKTNDKDKIIEVLEKKLKEKESELSNIYDAMDRLNRYIENMIEDTENGIRASMSLQRKFAYRKFPEFPDITFASKYIVSTSNRSSYFDIFELPDDMGIGLVLCDSEGYGMSAMVMSIIVSLLETPLVKSPDAFLETVAGDIKQFLAEDKGKTFKVGNKDVSILYMILNRSALELRYNLNNMPGVFVVRADERIRLDKNTDEVFKLVPGDKIVIPNNGLFFSKNSQDSSFELDNFIKSLNNAQHVPVGDVIANIGYEVDSFIDGKRSRLFGDLVAIGIELERRMLYVV
jgi:hypothetical protein